MLDYLKTREVFQLYIKICKNVKNTQKFIFIIVKNFNLYFEFVSEFCICIQVLRICILHCPLVIAALSVKKNSFLFSFERTRFVERTRRENRNIEIIFRKSTARKWKSNIQDRQGNS